MFLATVVAVPSSTFAQTSGSGAGSAVLNQIQGILSGNPGSIQQILQGTGNGTPVNPQTTIAPGVTAQTTTIPQASAPGTVGTNTGTTTAGALAAAVAPLVQTHLEKIMSDRAGTTLYLYGYDQVGNGAAVNVVTNGSISDDYLLGPGDQINVSIRGSGQTSEDYRVTVDRDGNVSIPAVPPVLAAGRRFGDFRNDLGDAIHRTFVGTHAFITVSQLRQINVMVAGEVNTPGMRSMTALSSPLDAILVSGGIQKTGSLRNIQIVRRGRRIPYDLYTVLTQNGHPPQLLLEDGDRIVVPPLGRTVAILGWVRKPAIYELPGGASSISTAGLVSLAGGLDVRGSYYLSVFHIEPDGHQTMLSLPRIEGRINDSDILFVKPAADQVTSQVTFAGGQSLAGVYSAHGHGELLSQILRQPGALGQTPYSLFGIVSRKDSKTYLRSLIAFSPIAVTQGRDDLKLQSDDVVRVFSTDEIKLLNKSVQDFQSQVQQSTDQSYSLKETNTAPAIPQLLNTVNQGPTGSTPLPVATTPATTINAFDVSKESIDKTAPVAGDVSVMTFGDLATQLNIDPVVLINFVVDHQANIDGAVRGPGAYIVGPGTTLADLTAAAGGTENWADRSGVQVTSTAVDSHAGTSVVTDQKIPLTQETFVSYIVKPQDDFHFNRIYSVASNSGQVTLQGEIRSPGDYHITHGEHLSELLVKAGGLTDQAYPYGTVFLRRSVAADEAVAYQRVADQLQTQLLVGMGQAASSGSGTASFSADSVTGLESLIAQLRNESPVGRVSFIADPSVLAANPQADPTLEPGDTIFIPQRPSSVIVIGEVKQPGSFVFSPDKSAQDYLAQAGGYGRYADEGNTYIIYPDGTAKAMDSSWLQFESSKIPPGSVIFVPKNILQLNWVALSISIADVLKDLALSAASLAILHQRT